MNMTLLKTAVIAALVATATFAGTASAAGAPDGKAIFTSKCGMCHQTIGMAVNILARRPNDPSKGFLEDRKDLTATFVKTVVRSGIANMPRMSRGEVSDPELALIANYLSQGKP